MSGTHSMPLTVGVEEEYHLVDPDRFSLVRSPTLSARAAAGEAGPRLQAEMLTSQIEAATEVCHDLEGLRAAIVAMRAEAAAAAGSVGATILGTSTHPFAALAEIEIAPRPRYESLLERFGTVVSQLNLCGCHVHVGVDDLDLAVRVMTHARPYLPLLGALTGSSPLHDSKDTGFESFRLSWLALWPQGGPPPALRSGADYLRVVEQLVATGLVDDASGVLWDVRPSLRYPTLEFRVADMCPDVDGTLLFAALVRSLVRTLSDHVHDGRRASELPEPVLRAARWRAARYGLSGELWSPRREALTPARHAIADLLAELRPDLERHGELHAVQGLLDRLLRLGTSAARQRDVLRRTGSLTEVVRAAADLTTADR